MTRAAALACVIAVWLPSVARGDRTGLREETTGAVLTGIGGLHLMGAVIAIESDVRRSFQPCAGDFGLSPCGGAGGIGFVGYAIGMPMLAIGLILNAVGIPLLVVGHWRNRLRPTPIILGGGGLGLRF